VSELLTIVAYVTADDGPLRTPPDPTGRRQPLHQLLLRKAIERLDVLDTSLRSRVVFLVAGRNHGYYVSESEVDLAGAALDTCRAATTVVGALLEGVLPSEREFDAMGSTVLKLYQALEDDDG
jgi:hypothetical protein